MTPEAPPGRRLHNDEWGFDSNCFVCERSNEVGLRIPFYADEDAGQVTARFTLDDSYSGAPTFVHGGITLAILDEAQAWATIALAGKLAVTTETTSRFRRPVMIGEQHEVVARIVEAGADQIQTSADVRNPDDEVCATTTATFAVISEAVARTAVGQEIDETVRGFLR